MKVNWIIYCLLFIFYFTACSPNNVTIDDGLQKYFDSNHVTGSFALYDNGQGKFDIYNLARYRDSAYLPASTFKIINSLIGLETGVISDEKMVIKWDSVVRKKEWDKDLTMEQAFAVSAVPYYQEVARRIGTAKMQFWLDSLHYGARYGRFAIKNNIDTFWLDNSLKVTADEQLAVDMKLYFGQLPFQKRTQDVVRKVMLRESNANYKLSYKTGFGYRENGNALGWVVGWIEENKHPYFFVLNVEGPHDVDIVTVRMNILRSILKDKGFFEGRK